MNKKLVVCNGLAILLFMFFTGTGVANDITPLDIDEARISMSANVATGEGQCDGEEHFCGTLKGEPIW